MSTQIKAFIAHSFAKADEIVVNAFLKYFDTFKEMGLEWTHAEPARSNSVAEKVKSEIRGADIFIGIFSRKHLLDNEYARSLNPNDKSNFWSFLRRCKKKAWVSSGWTLQESGYGISQNAKLILLVEDDIVDIGGLQGDFEAIIFNRNNPSACFQKLNEILTNLLADAKHGQINEPQSIQPIKDESQGDSFKQIESKHDNADDKPTISDLRSKILAKDEDGAAAVLDSLLKENADSEHQIICKSLYLWYRIRAGYAEASTELKKLSDENPKDSFPYFLLGLYHEQHGILEDAIKYYEKSLEHETKQLEKIRASIKAALCHAKKGKINEGISLLNRTFKEMGDNSEITYAYYEGLSQIFNFLKDDEKYTAVVEKTLQSNPYDHDLRFKLAYKYNEMGRNTLAMYHYRFLAEHSPNDSSLNNLGVVYSELDLECNSVKSYQQATKEGSTLATANLAYKLMNEGFLNEARTLLDGDVVKEECHPNVHQAKARLADIIKEEDEKIAEITIRAREQEEFEIKFATSLISDDYSPALSGKWSGPDGEIGLSEDGEMVKGYASFKEESFASKLARISSKEEKPYIHYNNKIITLDAKRTNNSIIGTYEIKYDDSFGLLSASNKKYAIRLVLSGASELQGVISEKKDEYKQIVFKKI